MTNRPIKEGSIAGFAGLLAVAALPAWTWADTLVVLNKSDSTASLVDLHTLKVRATLPTGEGPHEAAVSPDGRTAVVTNYGGTSPGSTLTVLDVPGARVVSTIDLGRLRRPHGIVWIPGTRRVAVTSEETQSVAFVDVPAKTVVAVIETGQKTSPIGVALDPKRGRAFVAHANLDAISILNVRTLALVGELRAGREPDGMAYSRR